MGIRVNPQCSTQEGHAVYDPCAPGSRLGVTRERFRPEFLDGVEGIHFHTLCEQDAGDLKITLDAVEEKFGEFLYRMKWVNFGGGHHITRPGYNIPLLEECIRNIQEKYRVTVYLEPGEAVALNAGVLLTRVLDTFFRTGILPFWMPLPPVICRMCWKCLIGLRLPEAAGKGNTRIHIVWQGYLSGR